MKTSDATSGKMDLLLAVEKVIEKAKGSNLDGDFYKKVAKPIKYLSEKLDLTKEQSLLMALFIDNSSDNRISIKDLAKHLDCSTTKIIRLMNDIDELERKEFIIRSVSGRDIYYRVPWDVICAFRKNVKYEPVVLSNLSCQDLFNEFADIFQMRDDDEITYETTKNRIWTLLDSNKHLIFVQKIKSLGISDNDQVFLVLLCHLFVNNADDNIGYNDISFLFEKSRYASIIWSELKSNTHVLQLAKIVEFNNDNGFVNDESYRLTWDAKKMLFPELKLATMNKEVDRNKLVKHENITPKQLFYDKDIQKQVTELGELLSEDNYHNIVEGMKKQGFRCGFSCLFYGAPGTGKTETVLQLAKRTGRDLMQVNVSEIKSMWVGESEKNINKLFDQYQELVSKAPITPILLFNEADAIISKRQEGAERAVDKMENSIQNIILQKMETLNGILIATTNLAQNMDKAFERRFLYKIKFNKPSIEARMSIWREMIPSLSEADAKVLASKYDFSGGQIENIARHYTIDTILHGDINNIVESLSNYCDNERIETTVHRKIGFN